MDELDEFFEYDVSMGSDVVICPKCGEEIPCSVYVDDTVECPKCGTIIHIEEEPEE